MRCSCGGETRVLQHKRLKSGEIRRRRRCVACGAQLLEGPPPKPSGRPRREPQAPALEPAEAPPPFLLGLVWRRPSGA